MSLESIFPKLAAATRLANGLSANDVNFYKSLDKSIASKSEETSNRLLKLINQVTTSESNEITSYTITDSWKSISGVLDSFLESADIAFDELNGQTKTKIDIEEPVKNNKLEKPQLKFNTPIDNSELHPFKPKLTSKPNAITPFEEVYNLTQEDDDEPAHYRHPYETEIQENEYNTLILEKNEPILYKDWDSFDAIFVDNVEELNKMVKSLEKVTEIAVDLEHHDYRSYYGITCLMQISTRDQDWLVDTLKMRDDLEILNKVFTNPQITKVLHGAFMDIIWLQRDLGLYIVSLFDTYHASRLLGFPKHSLAYLLETYANFKASKKYQLADWRIRPLTAPMRAYARADTHYLLYIYDILRNTLIEQNKLQNVLFESRNVALRRFEYTAFRPRNASSKVYSPIERSEPWKALMYQYNIPLSKSTLLHALYNWRDEKAREEDESPRYIMPNQLLVNLTTRAPIDAIQVLSSGTFISESVRKNCNLIANIIKDALKVSELEDFKLYDNASQKDDETISQESVEKDESVFKFLVELLDNSLDKNVKFNDSSELFTKEMLEYSDMDHQELRERENIVQQKLNKITAVQLINDGNDTVDNNNDDDDAGVEAEASQEEKEETKQQEMFEDRDDIIVLRKKSHKGQKQRQSKKDTTEIKQNFNYDNAEKVIQVESRDRRDKKSKKRPAFDPYSLESEGPAPAKRQSKPLDGKTTSFIHRKKKK